MPQTLIPNNPAFQLTSPGIVAALALDKTFQAADNVNGNAYVSSGNDLLIMYNSDSAAHTVTFNSVADAYGRFATLVYTIQPGVYSFVNITPAALYTQGGTMEVQFLASSALIGFLVVMNG
jgi:hypothetical protein